jgi:hypothetical protein
MYASLERLSDLHRVVDQASKAAVFLDRYLAQSKVQLVSPPGGVEVAPAKPSRAGTLPHEPLPQEPLPQEPLSQEPLPQESLPPDAAPPAGDLR